MVQLGDLDREASRLGHESSHPRWDQRHRALLRVLVGIAAVVLLLVILPSLAAAWQGLLNLNSIGDDASGGVIIQHCDRGDLVLDWTCYGTWSANDPMANPVDSKTVTVVNNSRHLAKGTELGFVYVKPGTNEGFESGATVQAETIALWLGVMSLVTSLVLLGVTRRSRALWPSIASLALAGVLVVSAWDLVA